MNIPVNGIFPIKNHGKLFVRKKFYNFAVSFKIFVFRTPSGVSFF